MANISALSTEVIFIIFEFLEPQEVATFAAISKHFYGITDPFLYQQDTNGKNPKALRWAAGQGQMVTFQKALKASEDINVPDSEGKIPLHYTTYCYDEVVDKMVQHLVDSGALLDASSKRGTPLELACENQNFRAAIALINAGAEFTDDLLATCVSSIKVKSAGGLVPDETREHSICLQGTLISKLIYMGLCIDWRPPDEDGETALMRAVCDGEPSMVRLLLGLGAKANSPGGNDTTSLMCAVQNRKAHCVSMLIDAGTDVNLLDRDGVSAIYFLSPSEISEDTAYIWTLLLRQGSIIETHNWYPEYGAISIFELAVYEALQDRCLPLDLIIENSKKVSEISIWRVQNSLGKACYNPPRFLECLKADDKWLIFSREMETELTLQSLQQLIKDHSLYRTKTSS